MSDIKSMGLYRNVERIMADLRASGFDGTSPLTVDDLTPYDQYHYEGTDAVDDAIAFLGANPAAHILDVGSGLGGPARYIADRSGAAVTGLELQPDLNETAAALTVRAGLSALVTHVNGDVLAGDAGTDQFTGLVSMLCFLHIPDRASLFANCANALQSGSRIFIDDYYERGELTTTEWEHLANTVYCTYLPDQATYVKQMEAAGFVDVQVTDKTNDWADFVGDRLGRFREARPELIARYDEATVESLDHFYATVVDLFGGGNLGGLRVTARRP